MMDTSEFKSSDAESVHPLSSPCFLWIRRSFPGYLKLRNENRQTRIVSCCCCCCCCHHQPRRSVYVYAHNDDDQNCPIPFVPHFSDHRRYNQRAHTLTHSHTRSDNIIYGIWIWLGNMSDLIIIHYGRSRDAFLLLSRCFIWTDARTLSLRSPSWPFEKPAELFELKL